MTAGGGRWRALLALIAVSWGSVAVIVQAVDMPAAAIAFYRVALAATALGAGLAVARRLDLLRPRGSLRALVGLGVLLGLHWFAYFETIKLSSVALGVLMVYTGPLFIALLAPRLTGVPTGRATWPALAAGGAGVALVATDQSASVDVSGVALAVGLVAGVSFALLMIVARLLTPRVSPPAFIFWETATASLVLLPIAVGQGGLVPPDAASVAGLLALGVGVTALIGLAFALCMRHVDAQSSGVLGFLEPVSSVALAWAILGQEPSARALLGGALVLLAGVSTIWIAPLATAAGRRRARARGAPEAPPAAATLRR